MSAKKIFDILPPKKEPSPETLKIKEEFLKPKKRIFSKKILIFIFSLLIFLAIFCHFSSKAEIEIWPKMENLSFEEDLISDINSLEANFSKKIIPGKILSREGEISQEFLTTGSFEKKVKAKGLIRVYNNYHLDQILVATTRFVSADGKLFRSTETVNIPAGRSLDVFVEAAEPGPEYNIKPSTFSIPGLLGTPRYHAIYGKSFSPMEGGFIGNVPQVKKEDLERAKNHLVEELSLKLKRELENLAGPEFLFLEKNFENEILDLSFSKKEGQEAEKFEGHLKLKSKIFVFKNSDLKDFAKESVLKRIKNNKKIKEDGLRIEEFVEKTDFETGKLFLKIKVSAETFSDIDLDSLKEGLRGKSLTESEISLNSYPEIEKAKIRISPFWIKKIPEDIEKIKVNLNLK